MRPLVVTVNSASADGRLAAAADTPLLFGDPRGQALEEWSTPPDADGAYRRTMVDQKTLWHRHQRGCAGAACEKEGEQQAGDVVGDAEHQPVRQPVEIGVLADAENAAVPGADQRGDECVKKNWICLQSLAHLLHGGTCAEGMLVMIRLQDLLEMPSLDGPEVFIDQDIGISDPIIRP